MPCKRPFLPKLKKQKILAQLKKDLDKVFNKFIRQRDQSHENGFMCISCGDYKPTSLRDAGHFYSAGHHSATRWDEDNCHGQCQRCNRFLHGNLLGYREGLLKKIGPERLERLEIRRHNKNLMSPFEIQILIDQYKLKFKDNITKTK